MLTEKRQAIILDTVIKQKSVQVSELCKTLNTSESTIRRDLTALDKKGMLKKVHGGAVINDESFSQIEYSMEEKSKLYIEEKKIIAKYAASLIADNDFVFIDAGTTTERMIDYLPEREAVFVTNGFIHAKKLAQRGFKVFVLAGEFKLSTEAVVGAECVLALQNYNFTKCFMGTNGISVSRGLSTPDRNEANVKTAAIRSGKEIFVLADHSKFDQIASITFNSLNRIKIITDKLTDKKFLSSAEIKEVIL